MSCIDQALPLSLRYPYPWPERRPTLSQGVFFVPAHYAHHARTLFPGWEILFAQRAPVVIEYCSGNGAWIVEKAKQHPEKNWVAVERKFERLQKMWKKREKLALTNLLLVCGEAWTFTHYYTPTDSVAEVFVNFPDPWPKVKHAKHRLIQPPFVQELARVMRTGASITLVTDDIPYSEEIMAHMRAHPQFSSKLKAPHFTTHVEGYGTSYFDALFRQKGKAIRYLIFEKRNRSRGI